MKKITLILFLFSSTILFAQNQLLSELTENYDSSTGSYENSFGYDYTYDTNNNLTSETYYFWDSFNNSWVLGDRTTYTYNTNNKVVTEVYEFTNNGIFGIGYRTNYIYNSAGDILVFLDEDYVNGQYENDYRLTFSYANGRVDSYLAEEWNGSQWVQEERGNVTYNSNGFPTIFTYEEIVNGMFETYGREVNTVTTAGLITRSNYEVFDGTNFVEDERYDYTFDSNNNIVTEISSYNPATTPNEKYDYTYDTSILMSTLGHPFKDKTGIEFTFSNEPHINKVLTQTYSSYDSNTMSYDLSSRTTYNYNSTLSVDEEVLEKVSFKVFPNPTKSQITVEATNTTIDQIQIIDILGKTVFTTDKTNFEIASLTDGIYIMKIIDSDGSITNHKIIKE